MEKVTVLKAPVPQLSGGRERGEKYLKYIKERDGDWLRVERVFRLPIKQSAGRYKSKFYTEIRDKEKLWANKCPECGRIWFPPRICCGACKIKIADKDENWLEVGPKGTVVIASVTEEKEIDWVTGREIGYENPCTAAIRPDGGDAETYISHLLDEKEAQRIKDGIVREGTRVEAVFKPKEERCGNMDDIRYFRVIEE